MEQQEEIFSKGIGTKEPKVLTAKKVTVVGRKIEAVIGKTKNPGKEVGKKLVLIVKHPDKEEPINISEIIYIVDNKTGKLIKSSALWLNMDEDGNIQKGSLIAKLLEKYGKKTVDELIGIELETELDNMNYLAIKAY